MSLEQGLASRLARHSIPFTQLELRDRIDEASANHTFDSSLKLRPLLPKHFDAGHLARIELPNLREHFKDSFNPPRSLSLPSLLVHGRPLKVYQICGKKYIMQQKEKSEPVQVWKRMTQDGRELTYRLEMCQQPRQARACGNGARCKLLLLPFVGKGANFQQRPPTDVLSTHLLLSA